jgi:hypothetical protein
MGGGGEAVLRTFKQITGVVGCGGLGGNVYDKTAKGYGISNFWVDGFNNLRVRDIDSVETT